MAQKRSALLDALPSVSSEEEKEDEEFTDASESDEKEPESKSKSKPESEDEEEEEESEESDEEEEEAEEKEKSLPIPPPADKKPSVQKPQSSSESDVDEESGSESDSGDTQQSPTASAFTVKPILSKPMPASSDLKKPAPKPAGRSSASTPLKPAAKRPAETQPNGKGKKSKVSNKADEDGAIEEKKSSITRLWSEKDEIVVLKGMISYKSEKGSDPSADLGAFHDSVKGSLRADITKNQLTDKIRRLKKKYQTNAEKGENGEDPVFSRSHENKTFELSKKIWGSGIAISNGGDDNGSTARKSRKIDTLEPKEEQKAIVAFKEKEPVKDDEAMGDQKDFRSMYPRLCEGFHMENSVYLTLSEDARNFLKENLSLIGSSKAKEFDNKWKNLQVEELELYSKRMELISEQSKMVLDALKSSKN